MDQRNVQWTLLVPYRETQNETLPLDEESLVVGLQSLGISPTHSETDGRKLRYHFDKVECMAKYQMLQKALSGALPPGETLMVDFCKEVLARQGWRNSLAMMRNVKYVQ